MKCAHCQNALATRGQLCWACMDEQLRSNGCVSHAFFNRTRMGAKRGGMDYECAREAEGILGSQACNYRRFIQPANNCNPWRTFIGPDRRASAWAELEHLMRGGAA